MSEKNYYFNKLLASDNERNWLGRLAALVPRKEVLKYYKKTRFREAFCVLLSMKQLQALSNLFARFARNISHVSFEYISCGTFIKYAF